MIGSVEALKPGRRRARGGAVAFGMCLMLAGCLGEGADGGFGFLSPRTDGPSTAGRAEVTADAKPKVKPAAAPMTRAKLANGKVVVKAPRGYCIDRASMKKGLAGGFALIAACGNLGDGAAGAVEPVVMTVQVQPGLFRKDLPRAEAMATVLAPARALHKVDGDGLTLVHLDRGGDVALPKGDPKYWRGAMIINGYMVGLALYAPKGSPLAGKSGKRLILQLAENLLEMSPIPDFSAQAQQPPKKKN